MVFYELSSIKLFNEGAMISKGAGFANYSKGLCWVVSLIWLGLAVLSFTGEGGNSMINGLLWLAGAIAFAVSALVLGRGGDSSESSGGGEHQA